MFKVFLGFFLAATLILIGGVFSPSVKAQMSIDCTNPKSVASVWGGDGYNTKGSYRLEIRDGDEKGKWVQMGYLFGVSKSFTCSRGSVSVRKGCTYISGKRAEKGQHVMMAFRMLTADFPPPVYPATFLNSGVKKVLGEEKLSKKANPYRGKAE
jgi:hypothetical protein